MVAQVFLPNIFNPVGVLIDSNQNTYMTTDTSLGTNLTQFDSRGNFVGQVSLNTGFLDLGSTARLVELPELNLILGLRTDGLLLAINPDTLSVTPFLDLRSLQTDASRVYDVATGSVSNLGGTIQPSFSTFGDIAVFNNNGAIEIYATALSQAQTFPFIMRLRIEGGQLTESKVILVSQADALALSPQTPRSTRGIAVNDNGLVLTSLPVARPSPGGVATQATDVPVAFLTNFDPTDGVTAEETPAVFSDVDLYSQGATTDLAGNFYVVTNSVGSAAFGVPGEGALVTFSPDLVPLTAEGTGAIASSFRDVAVDPLGQSAFVSVSTFSVGTPNDDLIAVFPGVGGFTRNKSDFNGDNRNDLLLYNPAQKLSGIGFMDGGTIVGAAGLWAGWKPVGTGDFNQDGQTDVVIQNIDSSWKGILYMNGVDIQGSRSIVGWDDWDIIGVSNFNGDNIQDILVRHQSQPWHGILNMGGSDGNQVVSSQGINIWAGWDVKAVADFNSDSRADLVIQHQTEDWFGIIYLNDAQQIVSSQSIAGWADWNIIGASDQNNDGQADLLIEHQSQPWNGGWFMQGNQIIGSQGQNIWSGWDVTA